MKYFFSLIFILAFTNFSRSQEKTNVILIGTFHFNNPGLDAIKMAERNILTAENQKELELITNKIAKQYQPDKIFVEEKYSENTRLNELYRLYLQNKPYVNADTLKDDYWKRYYAENEIFQLAFRLGKKAGNKAIYGIDKRIDFRFDFFLKKTEADPILKAEFQHFVSTSSKSMNNSLAQNRLSDVFLALNKEAELKSNKGFYLSVMNKVSIEDDYMGANLVTDWYKRNLMMFANFQHQLEPKDKNVVILVGVGHAAMFYDFLVHDKRFHIIKLENVF
jgi:hypothetical protein